MRSMSGIFVLHETVDLLAHVCFRVSLSVSQDTTEHRNPYVWVLRKLRTADRPRLERPGLPGPEHGPGPASSCSLRFRFQTLTNDRKHRPSGTDGMQPYLHAIPDYP